MAVEEIDEIVQEFLVESHENLDQLDRDLVALEKEPTSHALLSSIFRTIHTIKGTSGFLAFGKLESVTHVGENLLARLRDGKMIIDPPTTDVLLAMVDTVRDLLAAIEATGAEGDVDVSGVVERVSALLDGRATAAAPTPITELIPEDLAADEPVQPTATADLGDTVEVTVPEETTAKSQPGMTEPAPAAAKPAPRKRAAAKKTAAKKTAAKRTAAKRTTAKKVTKTTQTTTKRPAKKAATKTARKS